MAIDVVWRVVLEDVVLLGLVIVVLLTLIKLVAVRVTVEVEIVMVEVEGIPSREGVLDEMFSSLGKSLLDVVDALVASVDTLVPSFMPSMLVSASVVLSDADVVVPGKQY